MWFSKPWTELNEDLWRKDFCRSAHRTLWLFYSEAMVTKDRGMHISPRETPPPAPVRTMLVMSGCLGVLGAGAGAGCHLWSFSRAASLLTDIKLTMMDLSVGRYSDPKKHLWGVCGRYQTEVSVGCSERSLGEISQSGCAGGPHVGTVWLSLWRLLVRGPPLLAVLPLTAREGHRDFPLPVSCCSIGVPLCHLSPHLSLESAPPPSALTSQCLWEEQAAPRLRVSALWLPLAWAQEATLCPGFSLSLRSWLSPRCCAHPGGWGPEARPGYR